MLASPNPRGTVLNPAARRRAISSFTARVADTAIASSGRVVAPDVLVEVMQMLLVRVRGRLPFLTTETPAEQAGTHVHIGQ
jgi:hypothetical protein